jgi:hypothetical protein
MIKLISDCFWTVAPPLGALGFALAVIHINDALKRRKARRDALAIEAECAAARQTRVSASVLAETAQRNDQTWAKLGGGR